MEFDGRDQRGGWGEVYILNYATIPQAVTALNALATVRAKLLSQDNTISGFRLTQPLTPVEPGFLRSQRKAYFTPRNLPGNFLARGASKNSDVLWTGVMLRLNNATRDVFKNQTYRGIGDDLWKGGDDSAAVAFMQGGWLAEWQAALIANNAGINHKIRPNGVAFQQIALAEYVRIARRATGRGFDVLRGRR
jgi:hypothetical protein